MKKIGMILASIFVVLGLMIAGAITENKTLQYLAVVVGGMVGLGIVIGAVQYTLKYLGTLWGSVTYTLLAMIIVGLLIRNGIINPFIGYTVGVVLGGLLILLIVRRIAQWSQKSLIGGEIFAAVSNYQIRNIIDREKIVPKQEVINYNLDQKNIMVVLKELKFTPKESKEAAAFAIDNTELDEPIESKVRVALTYLGDNNHGRYN